MNNSFLKQLRVMSLVEGCSTLLLFFVAMPLKYYADMAKAVSLVGSIHGVLFLIVVALFLLGIKKIPIPSRLAIIGIVAAVIPFGPFVMDRYLKNIEKS